MMQLSRQPVLRCASGSRQPRTRLVALHAQCNTQQQIATETVHQLDDEYNKQMAKQMNWSNPYEYHFDRGAQTGRQHTSQ